MRTRATQKYIETNRSLWDYWTLFHQASAFYDINAFKGGKTSLSPIEIAEVGNVAGKSLLHLQCHFGLDTLSWARLGAEVTGVDFSPQSIAAARSLSDECGIDATFICSEVSDLPEVLEKQFDVVFTSYGVLSWLPDLDCWATVVASSLKLGGVFYIIEFHPMLGLLDDNGQLLEFSYFHSKEPMQLFESGSYASPEADLPHAIYQWTYGIGDIVNALLSVGLKLEFLHEFPFSVHNCYPFFKECGAGKYDLKAHPGKLPLMFSIRAHR